MNGMRTKVVRIPVLPFFLSCLSSCVFQMSTSTLSDFEEDLYGSTVSSVAAIAAISAIANTTPATMKAPQKRLFAPFELDQIWRAWGLRLRPVRTRPCIPSISCIPYSVCAPVFPVFPVSLSLSFISSVAFRHRKGEG